MGTLGVLYVPKMSKTGTYYSAYVQKKRKMGTHEMASVPPSAKPNPFPGYQ